MAQTSWELYKAQQWWKLYKGSCGGGGIVRDNQRNMMFAYSLNLGQGTSNMVEAQAMLYGLKWYVNRGYDKVRGETDSLLLSKCINRDWKPPWRLDQLIWDLQQLVETHGFTISHCFREANKPANKLASLSPWYWCSTCLQLFLWSATGS